jgi:hypothetical protein
MNWPMGPKHKFSRASLTPKGALASAPSLDFDPGFTGVSAFYESIKFHEPQNTRLPCIAIGVNVINVVIVSHCGI